jgi:predicted aspartyl protease
VTNQKAWVDHKGRPVVLVERPDQLEPFLALIDTGCSLAMLIDQATANEMGVVEAARVRRNVNPDRVQLADGSSADLKTGHLSLVWNGAPMRIAVGITANGQLFPEDGSWAGTEPKALLGCQLLAGTSLTINFCVRTVEISSCIPPS